ncbi:MAG: PadR family transcriptional regulator [Gemmatimonadales bacterium]
MTNSAVTALAPRDLLILAVLADGPSHGYGIIKSVEERSGHDVLLDPANLYRCLRRMSADGWIGEVEVPGADERRRTYRISHKGRTILQAEVHRLESLLRSINPSLAGQKR